MAKREFSKDKHHGEMTVRQAGERVRELIEAGKQKERDDKEKEKK